jgi:hypothetical protein
MHREIFLYGRLGGDQDRGHQRRGRINIDLVYYERHIICNSPKLTNVSRETTLEELVGWS